MNYLPDVFTQMTTHPLATASSSSMQPRRSPLLLLSFSFVWIAWLSLYAATGATYYVSQQSPNASDSNPGTQSRPWKTLTRAGNAKELSPGDQVLIGSGVYRESLNIRVSGEPNRPITFAAEASAKVVIKGSEVLRGNWTKVGDQKELKEPYPNAFANVWRIQLTDAHFNENETPQAYRGHDKRWISQVFMDDQIALQRIGEDPLYDNRSITQLASVGRIKEDLTLESFYFEPNTHFLYVKTASRPDWRTYEIGVRGLVVSARDVHDVVIKGLEVRQNRQTVPQWPIFEVARCQRVIVEDCKVYQADFCGLALGRSSGCVVRSCDLSNNGNSGLEMGNCNGCLIEGCTMLFNNYRKFFGGWHAGGMKAIPKNRECTVQNCEVAYSSASAGIWFDTDNSDIRILNNICHHNGTMGIYYEINPGGGLIANNLVYANRGRGIFVSGSQNTWVVNNTVAENGGGGIVCIQREKPYTVENIKVLNNLFLRNSLSVEGMRANADLILDLGTPEGSANRTISSNHSDFNLFDNSTAEPAMRPDWNNNNPLTQWQRKYGEDLHSSIQAVPYDLRGSSFRLLSRQGLDGGAIVPSEAHWTPPSGRRIGSSIEKWP